ncbi:MAG: GatB/YqeY domain-containing protein [Patescibacteria group bacterium]
MLHQKINDDQKEVMKAGKDFEVGVLRMLLSVLHNKEIEKKGKGQEPVLTDDEVIEVLAREAKKRDEAAEMYVKGGRQELADKEKSEAEIIKKYLPEQLSEEETTKLIEQVLAKTGAKEIKDLGRVMAELMKDIKGRADTKMASEIVRKKLGGEK